MKRTTIDTPHVLPQHSTRFCAAWSLLMRGPPDRRLCDVEARAMREATHTLPEAPDAPPCGPTAVAPVLQQLSSDTVRTRGQPRKQPRRRAPRQRDPTPLLSGTPTGRRARQNGRTKRDNAQVPMGHGDT